MLAQNMYADVYIYIFKNVKHVIHGTITYENRNASTYAGGDSHDDDHIQLQRQMLEHTRTIEANQVNVYEFHLSGIIDMLGKLQKKKLDADLNDAQDDENNAADPIFFNSVRGTPWYLVPGFVKQLSEECKSCITQAMTEDESLSSRDRQDDNDIIMDEFCMLERFEKLRDQTARNRTSIEEPEMKLKDLFVKVKDKTSHRDSRAIARGAACMATWLEIAGRKQPPDARS